MARTMTDGTTRDLVERLEAHAAVWPRIVDYWAGDAMDQAIAEIKKLRAQLASGPEAV